MCNTTAQGGEGNSDCKLLYSRWVQHIDYIVYCGLSHIMLFCIRLMMFGLICFALQLVSHCLGYSYFFVVCYFDLSNDYFVLLPCSVPAGNRKWEPTCLFWL